MVSSILDTTPDVMDRLSPPWGNPTTVTWSCRCGVFPSARGAGGCVVADPSAQKDGSSTARTARSHACPTAWTRALCLTLLPCLRTCTKVWSATTCALVRMPTPPGTGAATTTPLPEVSRWGLFCHGWK